MVEEEKSRWSSICARVAGCRGREGRRAACALSGTFVGVVCSQEGEEKQEGVVGECRGEGFVCENERKREAASHEFDLD